MMMRVVLILLATTLARPIEITSEDIVIEELVADEEDFKSTVHCFIETIPCSEVGDQVKANIPEIVKNACADCSDDKKHIVRVFLTELKKKLPREHEKFVEKFDPEKKYFAALEAAVAA